MCFYFYHLNPEFDLELFGDCLELFSTCSYAQSAGMCIGYAKLLLGVTCMHGALLRISIPPRVNSRLMPSEVPDYMKTHEM